MTLRTPELSVIIPAYNEEKRLRATLDDIRLYFESRRQSPTLAEVEVIVVDDGSADGTARLVQEYARTMPSLRLVSNGPNRGKGYSVKHGMQQARGRIALFSDADLSAPIAESKRLLETLAEGNDIAIGSRGLDRAMIVGHAPQIREIAGIIFNLWVRLLIGLPFHDTQCGFKAFDRVRCQIIFDQQKIEGFGFDPEILFLARRHGLKTVEVPVRWAHEPGSKVRLVEDSLRMFLDLIYIRWNSLLGRYPRRVADREVRQSAG
jgi:glycosyltransferase involved in cell wall biosynthesis